MLERVRRPDAEPEERRLPRAPEPLPPQFLAAGNAAVARMIAERRTLARTRFKDAEAAREWIANKTEGEERPEGYTDEEWWTDLLAAGPYGTASDLFFNLNLLKTPAAAPEAPAKAAPKGKKQRTVPAGEWDHIVNGSKTITPGAKGKTESVTGLHTINGPAPKGRGTGKATKFGDHGCYQQTVEPINLAPGNKAAEKKNQSSFYPDDWTLEEIREAIEYAGKRGGSDFDVLTPEKGIGMKLHYNNAGYYPTNR